MATAYYPAEIEEQNQATPIQTAFHQSRRC